ncbi:MAG: hypothetical protein KAR12_02865 [Methylococcales bacterium]|nr:hypothetical protein [Methylococcales bacterium]
MANPNISIVLIIMMLISPIASAFDHCSGMDMSGYFSENQSLIFFMKASDTELLSHNKMSKELTHNQADMSCHISSSCTFHACSGYLITPSVPTVTTVISLYYSGFEYRSLYSIVLSPDLRPPILIL